MKTKKLLSVLGDIDDKYIIEAQAKAKKQKKPLLLKISAIAACLTVVIFSIVALQSEPQMTTLTLSETDKAFGFEGYFAHSIDELKNNNPWSENSKLKALPVYSNTFYKYTEEWLVTEPDTDTMKNLLLETAEALSMDSEKIPVAETITSDGLEIYSYYIENENYKVEINSWLQVNIYLKKTDVLPDGYTLHCNASYDELYKTAEFLKNEYKELLNMKNPAIDISSGDYTVDGERLWYVSFYENSSDLSDAVINYNFNRIFFYSDDNGELCQISFSGIGTREKIGDYPIIDEREALELLIDGKYITSVPEKFPGRDFVKKVELVYRNTNRDEIFMPFYKFYVQVDITNASSSELGLVDFGIYYVPAVEGEYIENMPQRDSSFN